jgi:hypothetical protein
MRNFCSDQGRTRVFGEAYVCTPQPETRGERRAGQKGPFMDGHHLGLANNPNNLRSVFIPLAQFISSGSYEKHCNPEKQKPENRRQKGCVNIKIERQFLADKRADNHGDNRKHVKQKSGF